MDDSWRMVRTLELRELGHSDPTRLIGMYRNILGVDELYELPRNLSFTSMIETIVNREEQAGLSWGGESLGSEDGGWKSGVGGQWSGSI